MNFPGLKRLTIERVEEENQIALYISFPRKEYACPVLCNSNTINIVFRTFNLKRSIHKGGEEVSEVVGTPELTLRSKGS